MYLGTYKKMGEAMPNVEIFGENSTSLIRTEREWINSSL